MIKRLHGPGLALSVFIALIGSPPSTALDSPPPEPSLPTQVRHTGTVTGIDRDLGRITIAHDRVATTQDSFPRKAISVEPGLLDNLKPGDKVAFTLIGNDGEYMIRDIRKQ